MNTLTYGGITLIRTTPAPPAPWRTLDGQPIGPQGIDPARQAAQAQADAAAAAWVKKQYIAAGVLPPAR